MWVNSLSPAFNQGLFRIYCDSLAMLCIASEFAFLLSTHTGTIIHTMKYYSGKLIKLSSSILFYAALYQLQIIARSLNKHRLSTHSSTFSLSRSHLDIITQAINFLLPCFTLSCAQWDKKAFKLQSKLIKVLLTTSATTWFLETLDL